MMNVDKIVRVHAPATVANMVCGFDVLGFAVAAPYDEMQARFTSTPGVTIVNADHYNLPTNPAQNVAGAALLAMLEECEPGIGIELTIKHADNIAPCIYGGVTLIRSIFPLDIIALTPPDLYVTIVHPQIEVRTSDARSILKQQIYLKDAIKQFGNVAGLVAGLLQKDYALIGRSLEDVLVEPVRSILIPGFDAIKSESLAAGALGGGISGSGPSIFMLSESESTALAVEKAMKKVCENLALSHHTYVTNINNTGIKEVDSLSF